MTKRPRPPRNAAGRQPIETLIGKTIRGVHIDSTSRFGRLVFTDRRGRTIFSAGFFDLADPEGFFFHHENTEAKP